MQNPSDVKRASRHVASLLHAPEKNAVGMILGTGLGGLTDRLQHPVSVDYGDIPEFPRATVEGHRGRLVRGRLAGRDVFLLSGRFHLYEGYSPAMVCMGVRLLGEMGISRLIVSNAAGGLNPRFETGSLMAITDHVNLTGKSPLTGENHAPWGPRFPDMSRVYSPRLLDIARQCALSSSVRLEQGVYAGVTGPQMETPAETRMLRLLGADAVGMSTVLEVVAARHMGMEILGLSCITNVNLPDSMVETSLADVLAAAGKAEGRLSALVTAILGDPAF
ncbi:purine-nucleoside phosphorylase [Desulfovibrio sulfodismutans]|uniref:Purine nucleoside phosphorylase n=1 Tax=Desulfolutivibrio sulfodismutans TaxID=63561 RepID=A0A7K3NN27_9BACT|nr:purine-nucleoside phosphorylase [Desulfolutivibrio sulfodismutans]NDY57233.1 purine-nucleoside phosphorylase [Desulfolutivibrio sulfodismutans]QLA12008.1 purine-nucleoside phosphorylase [Desulfolutivibrio sulfodismutans DSM 3696]